MTKDTAAKQGAQTKTGNGQPAAGSKETAKKTKRERFVDLAPYRVQAILDKFRQLGNCANRSNYEYTEADTKKIFAAIKEGLEQCEIKFQQSAVVEKKGGFSLE